MHPAVQQSRTTLPVQVDNLHLRGRQEHLRGRQELSEGLAMPREPAYAAKRSHDGEA